MVRLDQLAKIKEERGLENPEEYLAMKIFLLGIYHGMLIQRWLIIALCLQAPLWVLLFTRSVPHHGQS